MRARKVRYGLSLALAATLVLTSACTMRQGDLTVMSNRLVKLDRVDIDELPRRKRIEGKETKLVSLLLIPFPASSYPTVEGALDDALTKGDGDLLTDGVVKMKFMNFILAQTQTVIVEGDVVRTRGAK